MAMARKNQIKAEPKLSIDLGTSKDETVIIWKATRPLTLTEHNQLSSKLRYEQEQSGVKIILVPFSVEAEKKPPDQKGEVK